MFQPFPQASNTGCSCCVSNEVVYFGISNPVDEPSLLTSLIKKLLCSNFPPKPTDQLAPCTSPPHQPPAPPLPFVSLLTINPTLSLTPSVPQTPPPPPLRHSRPCIPPSSTPHRSPSITSISRLWLPIHRFKNPAGSLLMLSMNACFAFEACSA